MPTRQAGDLTGHLHGRRTGAGPEVLGSHVLFRETRKQSQGHHRGFRPRGRGCQSQPRNIHHHRSRTRRADPNSRSLPRPGSGSPGTAPGILVEPWTSSGGVSIRTQTWTTVPLIELISCNREERKIQPGGIDSEVEPRDGKISRVVTP